MFLTRVIMTPAGDVGPHDSLCQSHKVTSGDGWEAHEVKVPDKLGAVMQLSRMCNWNSPERLEVSSDSLGSYLLELRAKSLFDEPAAPIEQPVLSLGNGENGSDPQGASE